MNALFLCSPAGLHLYSEETPSRHVELSCYSDGRNDRIIEHIGRDIKVKRWIALALTVCFLLNPLGVFAQTAVSTEALIADLLMQVIGQLSSPSFAAELHAAATASP